MTTTREKLLQAVIDTPDDDAPRLAYAALMQAEGDRDRADFIRIQCQLARSSANDPLRADLQTQEKELLDRHAWEWAEEFGKQIYEWDYRRGFIERASFCLETSGEQILSILNKAPIRHIRDTSQFCDLSGVVSVLPHLRHLTGLEFWNLYGFENVHIAEILASPHLKQLRTLIFHHDRNGNMVQDDVLIQALGSPLRSNLEELALNVDGCFRGPSCAILKAMAESPYLRNLRKLSLSSAGDAGNKSRMDLETIRLLGASANFANLEALDLGRSSFSLEMWDEVLEWPCLANLKWLRLHYARQVQAPDFRYTVAKLEDLPEYRSKFESKVATVDWDTEFINPYDRNAWWQGFRWTDRSLRLLYAMNQFVRTRDYAALESDYRQQCLKLSGEALTEAIDGLSFEDYSKKLQKGLQKAESSARTKQVGCVFFRVRANGEWKTELYLNSEDPKIDEPRKDFMFGTVLKQFAIPSFPKAGAIYDQQRLYVGIRPSGSALYVLARTIATLGRALNEFPITVPVYFSCEDAVFRMNGPQASGHELD